MLDSIRKNYIKAKWFLFAFYIYAARQLNLDSYVLVIAG